MTDDPLARLRTAALHGLAPHPSRPFVRPARPPRGITHPAIPAGEATPPREVVPAVLLHEAAAWWRRCAPGWAPPLEALVDGEVVAVHREGESLRVEARRASYRVRALPEAWMVVVVAALTGREMVPTRAALRRGVAEFRREVAA